MHDYKKFASVEIPKSTMPFHFIEVGANQLQLPDTLSDSAYAISIRKSKTAAFLIIRNDSILYEYYAPTYSPGSIFPSFSVAKSFISLLTGIAIDEGYIKSVHDPITKYITELDTATFGKITIENLLDMRSGIRFNEGYFNPFAGVAKAYYGLNLKKQMLKLKTKLPPDSIWQYKSCNTQLVALAIERATGTTVQDYFHKKVWEPLGMEYDATWSIDSKKNKTIKAFCCLNARATDFAKLGSLYLNHGKWNGKQVVSAAWVELSTAPEVKNRYFYTHGWWQNFDYVIDKNGTQQVYSSLATVKSNWTKGDKAFICPSRDFFAEGWLDEYVYVNPDKNMVMVRLGSTEKKFDWPSAMLEIARHY